MTGSLDFIGQSAYKANKCQEISTQPRFHLIITFNIRRETWLMYHSGQVVIDYESRE